MKKIVSLTLLLFMAASLFSCAKPVIYEEEEAIHGWLKERTAGYTQVNPSSRMVLFQEEEGFKVRIDTGSDMVPKLTVDYDAINTVAVDNSILTVTSGTVLYGTATHVNRVFDPYRNAYTRALQVWQKDEKTFRIFFWIYGSDTDFYPFPKLLTEPQYRQMLDLVTAYTEQANAKAEAAGEDIINYAGEFMNLYKGYYTTEKAKNPNSGIFYEYVGKSTEYADLYRSLFAKMGLTEQDWRKSFEDLGYTGQKLDLMIVYCDLTVGDNAVSLALKPKDAYFSHLLAAQNPAFTYNFCPSLSQKDFVVVTVD